MGAPNPCYIMLQGTCLLQLKLQYQLFWPHKTVGYCSLSTRPSNSEPVCQLKWQSAGQQMLKYLNMVSWFSLSLGIYR